MPEQGSTGQDKDRTIIKQDHCLFQAMIFSHSSGESHFFLVSLALENEYLKATLSSGGKISLHNFCPSGLKNCRGDNPEENTRKMNSGKIQK